jgi:hypothetical protein
VTMGKVDLCTEDDVPAIAELHGKLKLKIDASDSEGLRDYYRDIFFHSPWCDDKYPSFVFRDDKGIVVGFIGVVARQMRFKGEKIKVAVSHRLMVDPASGCPLAAAQLVRRFLSGPQDLSFSDGANDVGRKFWEGMGGSTALIYSMNWVRPLRPCSYAIHILSKQKGREILSAVLGQGAWLVDLLGATKLVQPTLSSDHKSVEVDDDLLLDCVSEFSKPYMLCPEYNRDNWKWLMQFLRSNKHRGSFRAFVVYKGSRELIGAYAYYLNTNRVGEVMLLLARRDSRDKVLRHMFSEAIKENAICFWGRMEPRFLDCLGDNKCLFKRGSWALLHTKRPELADVINRGDAFLTSLEGELWLRSPNDRL